jgi:hypothetical protein
MEFGEGWVSWLSLRQGMGERVWLGKSGSYVPRIIRPGPCLRPARTSCGGLSRSETKFGSSAACLARCGALLKGRRGALLEKGRRAVVAVVEGVRLGIELHIGLDCVRKGVARLHIIPLAAMILGIV